VTRPARGRAAALSAAIAALIGAAGCAARGGPIPAPEGGAVAVRAETALGFQERVQAFYEHLTRRRFNALETFNDPLLRQHFRSIDLFFDYYADLATALDDANFEKSRPTRVTVEEFVFESETRVRVQVRFVGEDDRPLRPNEVALIRLDRWNRADESWWVEPGKL
jgi:hypothetical protein